MARKTKSRVAIVRCCSYESNEVYDLVWTDTSASGVALTFKRRFFIEPQTNLPIKTEFYRKISENGEFTLISKVVVQQMTDNEMQEAKDIAFPH